MVVVDVAGGVGTGLGVGVGMGVCVGEITPSPDATFEPQKSRLTASPMPQARTTEKITSPKIAKVER